jgi:hypothetical protein
MEKLWPKQRKGTRVEDSAPRQFHKTREHEVAANLALKGKAPRDAKYLPYQQASTPSSQLNRTLPLQYIIYNPVSAAPRYHLGRNYSPRTISPSCKMKCFPAFEGLPLGNIQPLGYDVLVFCAFLT